MPGFYGKLPSHGDFLQRGVSDEFINRWDAWLQDGIARSRSELGGAWLDVFLTSPLWRFALASGVVGGPVWAGILLPSVDRVGRYFPLTLVAELPPGVLPFELAVAGNSWFDWAETLARRTLEDELVDLNRLESELRESDALLAAVRVPEARIELESLAAGDAPCWLALAPDGDMGRFSARLADGLAAAPREPLGLWWSLGSERVAPSVLMTRGLPPASTFRELLCGATQITAASLIDTIVGIPPLELPPPSPLDALMGISSIVPPSPSIDTIVGIPPIVPPTSLIDTIVGIPRMVLPPAVQWQSAAVSNVGRVRDENQDAYVERASEGLWLVADGMGGHQGGGLASRLVAEYVERIALLGDITAAARDLTVAIQEANSDLRGRGQEHPGFDGGSTVVVLHARGEMGVVLWAGDSRLYRLRDGDLAQLTRDHSVGEEDGSVGSESHMLTRAVGGADLLALDELRLDLKAGDRLLLCSDGLYGDLTPEEISAQLARPDCAATAQGLVELALERGGTDNATAIVIAVISGAESNQNASL